RRPGPRGAAMAVVSCATGRDLRRTRPSRQRFCFLEVDGSSEVGSSASGTVEPVQVSFHQRDHGDTAYGAGSTGLKSIRISPALALLVLAVQELSEVNTPRGTQENHYRTL